VTQESVDLKYSLVLTVLFSWNYWSFGPCPSSGLVGKKKKTRERNVSETGSVSVIRRGETYTLYGPLERVNLSHSINQPQGPNRVSYSSPEDANRSSFRKVVFSRFFNTGRWIKSKNLVILSVIHHRQNRLESTATVQMVQMVQI
jgi:hypothetical protein